MEAKGFEVPLIFIEIWPKPDRSPRKSLPLRGSTKEDSTSRRTSTVRLMACPTLRTWASGPSWSAVGMIKGGMIGAAVDALGLADEVALVEAKPTLEDVFEDGLAATKAALGNAFGVAVAVWVEARADLEFET